jgi:hypothetical protein
MVDAKQQETRSLSWFRPRGRTSSSGVLKALYCSAPGVPVVGLLQASRERKRGFQVPGVVAGGVVLRCVGFCPCCSCRVWCLCVRFFVPCGKGVRPPFIDQGESESHARRAI